MLKERVFLKYHCFRLNCNDWWRSLRMSLFVLSIMGQTRRLNLVCGSHRFPPHTPKRSSSRLNLSAFSTFPRSFSTQNSISDTSNCKLSFGASIPDCTKSENVQNNRTEIGNDEENKYTPPWSLPHKRESNSTTFARFRQHVNPLSRRYQMPTQLPENWPLSDFTNVNLPLYLDIGCGKGGFLLELVDRRHGIGIKNRSHNVDVEQSATRAFEDTTSQWLPPEMNYLGLEIRPGVSQYAQARVKKRGLSGKLSFVGCNANVDLDRLLKLYQEASYSNEKSDDSLMTQKNNRLAFVSIQFPDPHFKKSHHKRRVVTPALIDTLAKFMKEGDIVFLQSDVSDVFNAMVERFVMDKGELYFEELKGFDQEIEDAEQGDMLKNPLGIPTEREVSVLNQGLPVFRSLFRRNGVGFRII